MRVLVACEESQTVATAFREVGHEAYSCDLAECSGGHPEYHLKVDALEVLKIKWDLIIAHPPCTYMSKAGARWMYPKAGELSQERYDFAMKAKAFFMRFLMADCSRICVENPTPGKIHQLPQYTQAIQPWWFGHPYTKRTCLWFKNLPPLPLPILFGKELPRMLMEVVKTLMGITEDFRVGMSVTQKLVQKHFRVLHKQWPDSGEAI